MKCPVDGATLSITDRSGIEIDYCPECRGVWLDRGELDKLIDRAAPEAPAPRAPEQPRYSEPPRESYGHKGYGYDDDHYHKKKRKESFLGDIFDF